MAPDTEAKIPCPTPQHLQAELENLTAILALGEKEETWDKMEKALIRFAGVTRGGGYKHLPLFTDGIGRKGCASKVAECMLSDRGRLSTAAVEFLQAFAPRLHQQFAPVVQPYFEPLLKLFARPNKVFLKRSERCLIKVLENCQLPQIILELRKGLNDDAVTCRRICSTGIERAMNEWDVEVFTDKSLIALEEGLRRMGTDKDAEVRQTGKRVWIKFMELWPERVDDFSAPLTPTIRRYLNLPAQGVAVKGKGKVKAAPAPARPVPVASTSAVPAQVAAKPVPLRVAALVPKVRAPRPAPPVEQLAPPRRDPSPKKISPKKLEARPARNETIPQVAPAYRSAALAPILSRPVVAPLPAQGRSVSQTILPTVHSSTSISTSEHPRPRPLLPQSYSTTALPTEPAAFVSRFATGPMRILRPAPISVDEGDDELISSDGFLYTPSGTTVFGGPSRPPQQLGHGRKPIGQARRVVTAPTPGKEGLGYPTRTPAAKKVLARSIREKLDEVEEQPILASRVDNPKTPAPMFRISQKTPAPVQIRAHDSPLLPVLPPNVELEGGEDLRDTSMLQERSSMESPVPVEIAASIPLPPDEVDEVVERLPAPASNPIDTANPVIEETTPAATVLTDEIRCSTLPVEEAIAKPAPPLVDTTHVPILPVEEASLIPTPRLDKATLTPATADESEHEVAVSLVDTATSLPVSNTEASCDPTPKDEVTPPPVDVFTIAIEEASTTIIEDVAPIVPVDIPASTPLSANEVNLYSPTSSARPVVPVVETKIEPPAEVVSGETVESEAPIEVIEPAASTATAAQAPTPPATSSVGPILPDVKRQNELLAEAVSCASVESDAPIEVIESAASTAIAAQAPTSPTSSFAGPIFPDVERQNEPMAEIASCRTVEPEGPIEFIEPVALTTFAAQAPTPPDVLAQKVLPSDFKVNPVTRAPSRSAQSRPAPKSVQTVKPTTTAPAPVAPPRRPPVPRAAAISRPIRPVERKAFRPVTAAQTAAAAALSKIRNEQAQAQALAQAQADKPRAPSRTVNRAPLVETRARVPSAASPNSAVQATAGALPGTAAAASVNTASVPASKATQSRLLAPTKASASRAAPPVHHTTTKPIVSTIASNSALPPVRKEKIKLKAALPSFRPVRSGATRSTSGSGPGNGTWVAASSSSRSQVSRAAAIPLPRSPVAAAKSGPAPEHVALPPSPVRPETMPLPASPIRTFRTSSSSATRVITQPALLPLPVSPPLVAAEVPLPDSPTSSASQRTKLLIGRAASPSIAALQARLATPSRNSSAPTMSDQESDSDSDGEDETSGVTFKVKSDIRSRPQSAMKFKLKSKVAPSGDLMEFSAPARMEKIYLGSTTPLYTPGRKALNIRDANLASPLVSRKVGNE